MSARASACCACVGAPFIPGAIESSADLAAPPLRLFIVLPTPLTIPLMKLSLSFALPTSDSFRVDK